MFDLMFKATDKAAWDAFVESWPDETKANVLIDEIGPIVITPAVLDENGEIVEEAIINAEHHVNLRVLRPATTWVDEQGDTHTSGVDCAVLAQGGTDVEWIDPAIVTSPERIWAGGMNYWVPEE